MKYLILEHFLQMRNIIPLSGRVYGTRCQISEGAQAPVAPALTRALFSPHICVFATFVLTNSILCRYEAEPDFSEAEYQSPYTDIIVEGEVTQVTRFFKVIVYVGVITPMQASGKIDFKICYPSKYNDWRTGMMNLFGMFPSFPDLDSRPIRAEAGFQYSTQVVSNDDARDLKVEAVSELSRFLKL